MNQKSLLGIGLLQLEIVHLMAIDKRETFEDVEKNINDGKLVRYLVDKYKSYFMYGFDYEMYGEVLEDYFQNHACNITEYRIFPKMNGLLLVLLLIGHELEKRCSTWID